MLRVAQAAQRAVDLERANGSLGAHDQARDRGAVAAPGAQLHQRVTGTELQRVERERVGVHGGEGRKSAVVERERHVLGASAEILDAHEALARDLEERIAKVRRAGHAQRLFAPLARGKGELGVLGDLRRGLLEERAPEVTQPRLVQRALRSDELQLLLDRALEIVLRGAPVAEAPRDGAQDGIEELALQATRGVVVEGRRRIDPLGEKLLIAVVPPRIAVHAHARVGLPAARSSSMGEPG